MDQGIDNFLKIQSNNKFSIKKARKLIIMLDKQNIVIKLCELQRQWYLRYATF